MNNEKGIEDLVLLGVLSIPVLYYLSTWVRDLMVAIHQFQA
ncbi:MAG: hypothetical protein WCS53_01815 [Bacilli bacterium]|jgi:hypothetical protein